MGVSYLATFEQPIGQMKSYHFFTNKRARKESPKAHYQADEWLGTQLREHGTTNVRCTISRVEFCIIG
jgi:hypothetical protein